MSKLGKVFSILFGYQPQQEEGYNQEPGTMVTLEADKVVVDISENNSEIAVAPRTETPPARIPGQVDLVKMGGEEIKAGTLH